MMNLLHAMVGVTNKLLEIELHPRPDPADSITQKARYAALQVQSYRAGVAELSRLLDQGLARMAGSETVSPDPTHN